MGDAKTEEDKLVSIRTHPDKTVVLRQDTGPRRYYSEAQKLAAEVPNFCTARKELTKMKLGAVETKRECLVI